MQKKNENAIKLGFVCNLVEVKWKITITKECVRQQQQQLDDDNDDDDDGCLHPPPSSSEKRKCNRSMQIFARKNCYRNSNNEKTHSMAATVRRREWESRQMRLIAGSQAYRRNIGRAGRKKSRRIIKIIAKITRSDDHFVPLYKLCNKMHLKIHLTIFAQNENSQSEREREREWKIKRRWRQRHRWNYFWAGREWKKKKKSQE